MTGKLTRSPSKLQVPAQLNGPDFQIGNAIVCLPLRWAFAWPLRPYLLQMKSFLSRDLHSTADDLCRTVARSPPALALQLASLRFFSLEVFQGSVTNLRMHDLCSPPTDAILQVKKDILSKIPVIGEHFIDEVAPEDNPF